MKAIAVWIMMDWEYEDWNMIRILERDKMRGMMKILLGFPFSRSLPTRLSNLYMLWHDFFEDIDEFHLIVNNFYNFYRSNLLLEQIYEIFIHIDHFWREKKEKKEK